MIRVFKGRNNAVRFRAKQDGELVNQDVVTRIQVYIDENLCLDTDSPGDPVHIELIENRTAFIVRFGLVAALTVGRHRINITVYTGQDAQGLAWGDEKRINVIPWPVCPE